MGGGPGVHGQGAAGTEGEGERGHRLLAVRQHGLPPPQLDPHMVTLRQPGLQLQEEALLLDEEPPPPHIKISFGLPNSPIPYNLNVPL